MDDEEEKELLKAAIKLGSVAGDIINSNKDNGIPLSRIKNTHWHELVYNPLALLQLSMPHKNQHSSVEWQVRNGESDLLLRAGKIKNKDGHFESAGLPYGAFTRYILLWVYFTVQHEKKRSIFLGHSESQILKKLDYDTQGGSYKNLHEHMPRLFHCDLIINKRFPDIDIGDENRFPFQGKADITEYQRFASTIAKFENKSKSKNPDDERRGYFLDLSEGFYNSIIHNPLPIDIKHVRELVKGGNSYKVDIYTFLADRLHQIPKDKPLLIEQHDIEDLFGINSSDKGKFYRDKFLKNLEVVISQTYKDANVEIVKKQGIVLHNSPPPLPLDKPESTDQLPKPSEGQ